jgi:hypothetical protein
MGGDITVTSAVGEGSTFTVRLSTEMAPPLPVAETSPAATSPAASHERRSRSWRSAKSSPARYPPAELMARLGALLGEAKTDRK